MDKVKGAIFSSLGDAVPEARFLDLFAGTGGLGIEALSRGADSVVFVEKDKRSADCIRRNLATCGFVGAVRAQDVFAFVREPGCGPFDVILADPPYADKRDAYDPGARLLALPELPVLLSPGGVLVLERDPGAPMPDLSGWTLLRRKGYGRTEVLLLSRA